MFEIFKMHARQVRALMADCKGISSLEYAVMAVGIVGAVALAASALGTAISTSLGLITTYLGTLTLP